MGLSHAREKKSQNEYIQVRQSGMKNSIIQKEGQMNG